MSLISSSSRNYKICLVCEVIMYGIFDCRYEVFVVDVGPCSGGGRCLRGPMALPMPLFRIPDDYPTGMGFFAFNSSIYFLGGCNTNLGEDPVSAGVFVYDTSSGDSTIKQVSSMKRGKRSPVVIGPVKEKFYVIGKYLTNHDFEQFDPKTVSWVNLCQPPVPFQPPGNVTEYCITGPPIVNNDRNILLPTPGGIFSYDTDSDQWSFYAKASIPFVYGLRKTCCAVSIGGDRFLGFTHCRDDGDHMVLSSYRYNSSDHTWHDFQYIFECTSRVECAYPMSLGDGVVSTVLSAYDRPVSSEYCPYFDFDNDPEPSTHYIAIGLFEDGPNFKRICSDQYREVYNMNECMRKIIASFPLEMAPINAPPPQISTRLASPRNRRFMPRQLSYFFGWDMYLRKKISRNGKTRRRGRMIQERRTK